MPVEEHEPARARAETFQPWTPPCVPDDLLVDPTRLSYLVVDEIVGDIVTLALAPWPSSDPEGRVRFPADAVGAPAGHLLVHGRELRERLYEGFMRRAPRVGDAFAAVLGDEVSRRLARSGEVVLDREIRLVDALPGRVADLTAEARNVAKLAFYAAVAGVQLHDSAVALGQVPKDGHEPRARVGQVRRGPWTGPFLPGPEPPPADGPRRWTVPRSHWPAPQPADLPTAIAQEHTALFYFLLNIGDGDSQLLLLPAELDDEGKPLPRRAIVVDASTTGKLLRLMGQLD
ncbi:MAG: hypothetical protein ACLGI3_10035, partial [Actinomycetes bacterium]